MKRILGSLRLGERIWAFVELNMPPNELLVNICGDLIRVRNCSGHHIECGNKIQLEVMATHPLKFQHVISPKGLNWSV